MIDHSSRALCFVALLAIGNAFLGCDTTATTRQQSGDVPVRVSDHSSVHSDIGFDLDTPQAVFSVAQTAAKNNDLPRILECHTIETQDSLVTHVIMGAAMMRLVADKFAERGDDRYGPSKKRVDSILEKYGVDLSNVSENDLQPDNDKVALFGQMAAVRVSKQVSQALLLIGF